MPSRSASTLAWRRSSAALCNLRFDDTNPETEDPRYVDAIQRDVRWLGFDWDDRLFYASDYFEQFYAYAVELVKAGKAYVDSLNEEEIRDYRGTVIERRAAQPLSRRVRWRRTSTCSSGCARGEFADGAHVLRAKIDMASPNMKMRDPLLYRIRHAAPLSHGRRVVHLPDVRLCAPAVRCDRRASRTRSARWNLRTTARSTIG